MGVEYKPADPSQYSTSSLPPSLRTTPPHALCTTPHRCSTLPPPGSRTQNTTWIQDPGSKRTKSVDPGTRVCPPPTCSSVFLMTAGLSRSTGLSPPPGPDAATLLLPSPLPHPSHPHIQPLLLLPRLSSKPPTGRDINHSCSRANSTCMHKVTRPGVRGQGHGLRVGQLGSKRAGARVQGSEGHRLRV